MLDQDPLWYKDAIIYEVHVRAFHDSVGDGTGDFRGLTQKLDYLEDLGVTAIWLLPFYPSPLKDDGYDIADYTDVHPPYGRLADFKVFLDEAHRRGIRVITELVINHTSDQHPWFQRARRSPPGSVERNFYVWSDTPERYNQARIIFKDFEPSNWTYDHVAKAYYWHRFYHHQPDLNFDNPAVWEALFPVLDFWLQMGVDGMRLDAIPYLYEREGTNCENLPETHVFLKALRKRLDEKFAGRMFLAEANQWPEDAVAYFGQGDECHMSFHFPVMPRLFMALHQEDRFPILDILAQTPPIPANCQWCMFLRNHDELTLEMVTDEERDYMVRAYAEDRTARINLGIRRRLAPLLRNDRRRIELMNALLFSLPGTPVIYYGDEIGMGDNIYLGDRNGVRTPMQWSADRNAGFGRANPQKLFLPVIIDPEYHYEAVNVEAQQNNSSSLLWWMKRLIALRKRFKAFGRGSLQFLEPANSKVLAFVRQHEDERILVVANLSRYVQHVELDLRAFAGQQPEELFGRSLFPAITEAPYPLTLGPHAFYWFALAAARPISAHPAVTSLEELPLLRVESEDRVVQNSSRDRLEELLPEFFLRRRPPGAPGEVTAVRIEQVYPFEAGEVRAWLTVVKAEQTTGLPEVVLLPLALVPADRAEALLEPAGVSALTRVQVLGEGAGPDLLLVDAQVVPEYAEAVLDALIQKRVMRLGNAELVAMPQAGLAAPTSEGAAQAAPIRLHRSERNHVSLHFGTWGIFKAFRRLEEGVHPDLELGRFLTASGRFTSAAPILGHFEMRFRGTTTEPITVGVLHGYVPHQANAWQYTLDQLAHFFERVAALSRDQIAAPKQELLAELTGTSASMARLLGQRTAEMHRALASPDAAEFASLAPEAISKLYQRSVYQSMRTLTGQLCARLNRQRLKLPPAEQELAARVAERQRDLLGRFEAVREGALAGHRIRIHGDYKLGQVLYTGNNLVVIDFEGPPGRPLGERKLKRSALRDVATMLRSFDDAVGSVLSGRASGKGRPPGLIRDEDLGLLEAWGRAWYEQMGQAFFRSYLENLGDAVARLLPATPELVRSLLDVLVLECALQEVDAALTAHPDTVSLSLRAVTRQLDGEQTVTRW